MSNIKSNDKILPSVILTRMLSNLIGEKLNKLENNSKEEMNQMKSLFKSKDIINKELVNIGQKLKISYLYYRSNKVKQSSKRFDLYINKSSLDKKVNLKRFKVSNFGKSLSEIKTNIKIRQKRTGYNIKNAKNKKNS